MTVINHAKFHHFLAKDTKVIDGGGAVSPPQAQSVLKRLGETGLMLSGSKFDHVNRPLCLSQFEVLVQILKFCQILVTRANFFVKTWPPSFSEPYVLINSTLFHYYEEISIIKLPNEYLQICKETIYLSMRNV